LAQWVLSIPASPASSERVFSCVVRVFEKSCTTLCVHLLILKYFYAAFSKSKIICVKEIQVVAITFPAWNVHCSFVACIETLILLLEDSLPPSNHIVLVGETENCYLKTVEVNSMWNWSKCSIVIKLAMTRKREWMGVMCRPGSKGGVSFQNCAIPTLGRSKKLETWPKLTWKLILGGWPQKPACYLTLRVMRGSNFMNSS